VQEAPAVGVRGCVEKAPILAKHPNRQQITRDRTTLEQETIARIYGEKDKLRAMHE
jgi:hypothetical protein